MLAKKKYRHVIVIIDLPNLAAQVKDRELKLDLPSLKEFLANPQEKDAMETFIVYVPPSFKDFNYLKKCGFYQVKTINPIHSFSTQIVVDVLTISKHLAIDTLVIVSGDNNFCGLCQTLITTGTTVKVVSFPETRIMEENPLIEFIDLNEWSMAGDTSASDLFDIVPYSALSLEVSDTASKVEHIENVSINKQERSPIPTFVFYMQGEYWRIGQKGNEKDIKKMIGVNFIHFLLNYPSESFDSFVVYHYGKTVESDFIRSKEHIERDHATTIGSRQQKVNLNALTVKQIRDRIDQLDKDVKWENYIDQEERVSKIMEKDQLQKYLNDSRRAFEDKHKGRTTIYKAIKRALKEIQENIPSLRPYLNNDTVKVYNNRWSYNSSIDIHWILYPNNNF